MAKLETMNRSTKKGFVAYMMANPVYFHQQFGLPPKPDFIEAAYKEAMRLRKQIPAFPKNSDDEEIGFVSHMRKWSEKPIH